jgi:hypothetical protein
MPFGLQFIKSFNFDLKYNTTSIFEWLYDLTQLLIKSFFVIIIRLYIFISGNICEYNGIS